MGSSSLVKCGCDNRDIISFKKFLEEHNAYDNYMNSLTYTCMEGMVEPKNWINFAFYWPDTLEGYEYWKDLNAKWLDIVNRTRKEIKWD